MTEILGRFGIEAIPLVAQIVNFAVIAFILQRFLIRPLMANLEKRREKIAAGLRDAGQAEAALKDAENQRQRILAQTRVDATAILDAARSEGERVREQMLERARADADRLLSEGRAVLATEREQAEREVRTLSLDLSGKILEKVVGDLFNEDEKRRVVARGLERIAKVGAS